MSGRFYWKGPRPCTPRTPVRLRASSLATLFDCPDRWMAVNVEGLYIPGNAKSGLGSAIHAGAALYDMDRVAGRTPSISAATDAAVAYVRDPGEEVDWDGEQNKAESIAASLVMKYCREESPRHTFVAVEATAEALVIDDLGLQLTGTVDRVRMTEEVDSQTGEVLARYGIVDIKSGKAAVGTDGTVKTTGHAAQMGVYELLAEHSTKLAMTAPAAIIGMQTNATPDKQRIGTGEIVGAREVVVGTESRPGLLQLASQLIHGEIPVWGNPKSMMCHKNYCPRFDSCFWRR